MQKKKMKPLILQIPMNLFFLLHVHLSFFRLQYINTRNRRTQKRESQQWGEQEDRIIIHHPSNRIAQLFCVRPLSRTNEHHVSRFLSSSGLAPDWWFVSILFYTISHGTSISISSRRDCCVKVPFLQCILHYNNNNTAKSCFSFLQESESSPQQAILSTIISRRC